MRWNSLICFKLINIHKSEYYAFFFFFCIFKGRDMLCKTTLKQRLKCVLVDILLLTKKLTLLNHSNNQKSNYYL